MQQKFTPTEFERSYLLEPRCNRMFTVYPKAQTLNFIKRFAYAYHAEPDLPASLSGMILN
jgi:hypothetical protein